MLAASTAAIPLRKEMGRATSKTETQSGRMGGVDYDEDTTTSTLL